MSALSQSSGPATLGLTSADAASLRAVAATCETVQEIINIAATAEALAVTALGGALANAANGKLGLNAEHVQFVTAARFEEQVHYEFLRAAGAQPLTLTFTVPDEKIVTDVPTFLKTVIALEEAFVAAYMTAAVEFAILDQPALYQVAHQTGGVEAEHRALARFYALGAGVPIDGTVPNNLAFAKTMFSSASAAAAALQNLGFIGGNGAKITYPGPGTITNPGVTNLRP